MQFELTEEISNYVATHGRVFLNACPGSGKTTAVAYKLSKLVDNWERDRPPFTGIACLSFTNVAKDEINRKYHKFCQTPLRYPHLVSTIDSFIDLYITLPHYHLLGKDCKRPVILEDTTYLDNNWEGRWNKEFIMKDKKPIRFSYPPCTIEFEIDGSYSFKGCDPKEDKVEPTKFKNYCFALKKWQVQKGVLKTTDSAFLALYLLKTYPRIGEYIAQRFPVIIVDEAQDTSEIQLEILKRLIDSGLKSIELVGDPYQCLYEWRKARPDLLIKLTQDVSWITLPLSRSRRSTLTIIKCFSRLRQKSDPNISTSVTPDVEDPILILKYSPENEIESINKFLVHCKKFQNNHVVVRGNSLRDKLLGHDAIELDFWGSSLASQVIAAKREFNKNLVKTAVDKIRNLMPVFLNPSIDYFQRKEQIDVFRNDHKISAWIFQTLMAIPNFDSTLVDWTLQTEKYLSQSLSCLFTKNLKVDFQLKKDNSSKAKYSHNISEFISSNSIIGIDVSTIHQVKGVTFDSVLLILNEHSKGNSISIKDISEPKNFPVEKQRLIYVAMSRPSYLLAIGVPASVPVDTLYKKFGDNLVIE